MISTCMDAMVAVRLGACHCTLVGTCMDGVVAVRLGACQCTLIGMCMDGMVAVRLGACHCTQAVWSVQCCNVSRCAPMLLEPRGCMRLWFLPCGVWCRPVLSGPSPPLYLIPSISHLPLHRRVQQRSGGRKRFVCWHCVCGRTVGSARATHTAKQAGTCT